MHRIQLFEIHEQSWCPGVLRQFVTENLGDAGVRFDLFAPVYPRLIEAIQATGSERILDLCSGSLGPLERLDQVLRGAGLSKIEIVATDLYPPRDHVRQGSGICYVPVPVDATRVPMELGGFRTLFSSFHHFPPDKARAILQDAVTRGEGIGVFEFQERSIRGLMGMLLAPFQVVLCAPLVRPFSWLRLALTWLLPIVPLVALFDGMVSCVRTYTPAELEAMTEGLDCGGYQWQIGRDHTRFPPRRVTFLVGRPRDTASRTP